MVTRHVRNVKAFGVADEKRGEGLTAEPQRPQRSEREGIGVPAVRRIAS